MLWTFTFDEKLTSVYMMNISLNRSEQDELSKMSKLDCKQVYFRPSFKRREEKLNNMLAIEAIMKNALQSPCKDYMIVTSEKELNEYGDKKILFVCHIQFDDPCYQTKIWAPSWDPSYDHGISMSGRQHVQAAEIGLYFAASLSRKRYGSLARLLLFDCVNIDELLSYGTRVSLYRRGTRVEISHDHDIYDKLEADSINVGTLISAHDLADNIMDKEQMSIHNNLKQQLGH